MYRSAIPSAFTVTLRIESMIFLWPKNGLIDLKKK